MNFKGLAEHLSKSGGFIPKKNASRAMEETRPAMEAVEEMGKEHPHMGSATSSKFAHEMDEDKAALDGGQDLSKDFEAAPEKLGGGQFEDLAEKLSPYADLDAKGMFKIKASNEMDEEGQKAFEQFNSLGRKQKKRVLDALGRIADPGLE